MDVEPYVSPKDETAQAVDRLRETIRRIVFYGVGVAVLAGLLSVFLYSHHLSNKKYEKMLEDHKRIRGD